mgnify:CR=1 FL=1
MDTFNIEYMVSPDTDEYVAGSNTEFAPLRERIVRLKLLADHILALFADALLYMSTTTSLQTIGSKGNLFYLLGGTKLYSAT